MRRIISTRITAACLAGMKPVFRGLRHDEQGHTLAAGAVGLQGRDPFLGDCDEARAASARLCRASTSS